MAEPSPFELLAAGDRPFGEVSPPFPPRPVALPDKDAREHALERLKEFVARLRFNRAMEPGSPTRGFRVPRDRIHVYQPDDVVTIKPPAIAFVAARGVHEYPGLGPAVVCEATRDRFGKGTVLVWLGDWVEQLQVQAVSAKHPVRRAIRAGLTTAFRLSDSSGSLRLSLPAYFGAVARFTLEDGQYLDGPDTAKNRRPVELGVQLRVPELLLVPVTDLNVVVDLGGQAAATIYDGNVYADLDGTPHAHLGLEPL